MIPPPTAPPKKEEKKNFRRTKVPLDVAVEKSKRRVRRLEPDDQVRARAHGRDVARLERGELRRRRRVIRARVLLPLRHDPEALPVQV